MYNLHFLGKTLYSINTVSATVKVLIAYYPLTTFLALGSSFVDGGWRVFHMYRNLFVDKSASR